MPAGRSTTITWSYATATSLSEAQAYAAAAEKALAPPASPVQTPTTTQPATTTPAPQSAPPPVSAQPLQIPTPAATTASPVKISGVKLTGSKIASKIKLHFRLSARANVRVVLQAKHHGHYQQLAVKTIHAKRGANSFAVGARWHRRLKPHDATRILVQLKPGKRWTTIKALTLTVR